ncbi:catechol 2,3-dioxygenase-like lactoylglutathione lyase family enzyme [Desulfobaculum xiamenense]|uniref:Catechol 2,3-dioxygenase-like lactoylglutathione lyase family enzyme n=1 Tax=Desulfobaculum xiamenense TaxID=995050 RepID=A0A846QL24_9BACT|nr:VOC family protein [Desulfobaculum xiamenense]NJB67750.1 catechol 2,3-dioxygenase-like lactoylglutathione lyase family enzyme [Desulfobaculum xiamenense]
MTPSFEGPAVFVSDLAASRRFYGDILGQSLLFAVGDAYAAYRGFSLWQASAARETIFGETPVKTTEAQGRKNFEMYFETEELDATWERLTAEAIEAVHPIREEPWGQRNFRVLDPDGHVVEFGEPMPFVARRFLAQGLSAQETAARTMLPIEMIQALDAPR